MTTPQNIPPFYLHPQDAANEPVTLHEGPVLLRQDTREAKGTGRLVLRFVPSTGLRLEAEILSGDAPGPGAQVKVELAGSAGDALISALRTSVANGVISRRVEGPVSVFSIGGSTEVASCGFQVLNFPDFLTPRVYASASFGFPPRVVDLEADGWRIRLTAVEKSQDVFKSLEETGGYAFTHLGLLDRIDGARFQALDADRLLDTLAVFLSFARGAACGLPVRWGVAADGAISWQRWGSARANAWKVPDNWFEEHHGSILSDVFPAFLDASNDADLAEPFRLALHWYQTSNMRAGGMEGAIILGLTALDLLGALVVVDRVAAMSESKFDKLAAAEKLTKLLGTMKVPLAIPSRFTELAAFAATNGWADAPVALAEIRHGYVHANRKRRKIVLAAPNLAVFQAWQLSLWYQELALLYFLNHRGEYRNRVTAERLGMAEKVPWA
jgi:hypothetical protein